MNSNNDDNEDAYAAARKLMYMAMSRSFLPFHVHATRKWAATQAASHRERAEAFEQRLKKKKCEEEEDDACGDGVRRLITHHQRIAARYRAVANAMQD